VTPDKMYLRPEDFYARHGVKTFLGRSAASLDPAAHEVTLKAGRKIGYGRALIATGGEPFVPRIEGLGRGVQTFTSWADAARLDKAIRPGQRALVLGGGLIGLKAAEALRRRGLDVTLVELARGILTLSLDERGSELAGECLREMGVKVICGNTVQRMETRRGERTAVLRDGASIPHDVFVCAVGVRPNAEIARAAGLEANRGVVVNERLETSAPDVYAAGDVTEGLDLLLSQKRPLPVWPSASRQGRIAGRNMAGADAVHEGGFAMNSVQINDVPFISAGLTDATGEAVESLERFDPRRKEYRRVVLRDNRIVGFVAVAAVDRAGIYTGLMRDRVDVANFRGELLEDSFGYISLPRQLRQERLARVATI